MPNLPYDTDGAYIHQLDLYLPAAENAPLVIFVHGGAFMVGTREGYATVGRALAEQGLATAVVSYRLYPDTDAQGSTADVARATAWLVRNAARYSFDARNVFIAGHSAGAQIAALIATNPRYLGAAGLPLSALRGFVAVAGAYDVRDLSGEPDSWQKVDGHIYGETPELRANASPSTSIDAQTPPSIVACGTNDDPGSCDRSLYFVRALHRADRPSILFRLAGADHMGMLDALVRPGDPLNAAFHEFIKNNQRPP